MILGIDTSCYTTSFSVVDKDGKIVFEENRMLKVKEGTRGLRQSDGFFQHANHLPEIFKNMTNEVSPQKLSAIAVSNKPRNMETSYMPVFHAGVLFCSALGTALGIPVYNYSHQEGHIMAALKTSKLNGIPNHFKSMHLSGGTTELLDVKVKDNMFNINIVGASLDISFGQLIDRIGVKMGLPFPAGRFLDDMSQSSDTMDFYKVPFKFNYDYNISGLENKYSKMISHYSDAYIAKHLFNTIEKMLQKWIVAGDENIPTIIGGGVASNTQIQQALDFDSIYFAKPDYARDNAFGIALLGKMKHYGENFCD